MTTIFANRRCLPDGWASDMSRISPSSTARRSHRRRGRIAVAAQPRRRAPRDRRSRHAEPAQPRLPARHGRAGRDARAVGRQFLELARGDVPLRADDDARPGRGGRGAALCRDAGGRLRAASASSTICTTTATAGPMPTSPRWPSGSPRRPTRPASALTLLPVFYAHSGFGGAAPNDGQRRFINDLDALRPAARGKPAARLHALDGRGRRRRPAQPARRDAGGTGRGRRHCAGDGPIHIHVAEQMQRGRGLRRLVGRAAGRMAARQCRSRPALVPDPRHAHDRGRDRRAWPGAARSPACARSPRPISATARFRRAASSRPAAASASARIPTC